MNVGPLPSGQVVKPKPAVFDLRREAETAPMASFARHLTIVLTISGLAFLVVTVIGFLGPLNPWWGGRLPEAVGLGASLFLVAMGTIFSRFLRSHATTELSVDGSGLEFLQASGTTVLARWHDPALEIRVGEFVGDPAKFFAKSDPRRALPQWVSVRRTNRRLPTVWTGIPPAAVTEILQAAADAGANSTVEMEELYWHRTASRIPVLRTRTAAEGMVERAANTRVTLFRG